MKSGQLPQRFGRNFNLQSSCLSTSWPLLMRTPGIPGKFEYPWRPHVYLHINIQGRECHPGRQHFSLKTPSFLP